MRISCLQLNPQNDVNENLKITLNNIAEAAKQGAETIVLPEMFTYMGDESLRVQTKSKLHEGIFAQIQTAAKEYKVNIVAGSHSEEIPNNSKKVYNTCVTYNKNGEVLSTYRKKHLFNLHDKNGNPLYCESDSYEIGENPKSYQLNTSEGIWNAFNIICYDLRFPEIIRSALKQDNFFDIIFVTAAFVWQTGKDHWEVLLRARAIENQCFVVACNQTGSFLNGQKKNYGNSMIIDPWGKIIARMNEETGIMTADIYKSSIDESRTRLPALKDRKIF
ncbi:nitrilase-related carbon-nitrogen hydrolase [Fluviispira vulneris]|uniref:nitrilase-related carbon-nitrogen hydrolase n=1 Tax=Fluviispira vulneris TaxID=2763012 RepID=UPI001646FB65|nr:nitrilase-related carbon-nitrogen hydrolase [Fluviispira vulneris]